MATLSSQLKLTVLDGVTGPMRRINGVLNGFQRQQTAALAPFRGVAGQLLAFGGAYLGVTKGISSTAGAAIKFEEAFADVRKVLDANDEQMANVRRSILAMSREMPIAAEGIAAIYAAAGQNNIPLNEINQFAEMVAKVSVAWDTTQEDTGQALAEIKNQLHLSVKDVGLFADSLNHLSNNTAANAPRLLEYTKRVAATGEMFGFSAQETLAFGGAMIASGGEAEVAATSFRNMGRALTIGTRATKSHNIAFKRLGLDSVKTAKSMQKNALKTTLDVIERIQTLPEWERISIASALFGDEARALMPLINNSTELRRQLGLVGDQANYAGSAFKEYMIRADTVGNALAILRNKVADVFRGIGDDMLPGIKEAALGIGDVLDTLGERATVFDDMKYAVQGFMQGFGVDGGLRELMNDLGDLLFGEADGAAAADRLGRIFAKFKDWGASVRELNEAIKANPVAQFFGELAGHGFKLMLASVGIAMAAGAVMKLGRAVAFLTGITTAIGLLKAVGKIGGILGIGGGGAAAAAGAGAAGRGAGASAAGAGAAKGGGWLARWLSGEGAKDIVAAGRKSSGLTALEQVGKYTGKFATGLSFLGKMLGTPAMVAEVTGRALNDVPHATMESATKGNPDLLPNLDRERRQWEGVHFEGGRHRAGLGAGPQPGDDTTRYDRPQGGATVGNDTLLPTKVGLLLSALSSLPSQYQQDRPVTLDTATINQIVNPRGIQDVRVTNKQPPEIKISNVFNITEASSGKGVAAEVMADLGGAVKSAVEAADTD